MNAETVINCDWKHISRDNKQEKDIMQINSIP